MFEKKRGGTHVGVILSFVIFVTFLIFLYTTIQPAVKLNKDKQIVLDLLKEEIISSVSAELTNAVIKAKITIEPPPTGMSIDCISLLSDGSPENFIAGIQGKSIVVRQIETSTGIETIQPYLLSTSYLKIGLKSSISAGSSADVSFKIDYADEPFEPTGAVSCTSTKNLNYIATTPLSDNTYTIGFIKTSNYAFKTKVDEFKTSYEAGYNNLKQQLDIPSDTEFIFIFTDEETGEIVQPAEKETRASIYSKEIPVQFINQIASINSGTLTIKVW